MRWFVLASGPSLQSEEIERVRLERESERCKVIVTNSTIFKAPFADACYAWDLKWWQEYHHRVPGGCKRLSARPALSQYGVEWVRWIDPISDLCMSGHSGGHHAIGYAYLQGATEIVSIGFDCRHHEGKAHHHEDHPEPMSNAKYPHNWLPTAKALVKKLKSVRMVNCGRYAKEMGMERMSLDMLLGEAA